ncbi:DUF4303 domain-containing protein [Streptomyces albidoflavus]
MSFDWAGLEQAVQDQLTGFVRRMRAEHPDDRLYAAAVHAFHAETGSVIAWPLVGVAGERAVASAAGDRCTPGGLRWSPADWPWQLDPGPAEDAWAARLEEAATADGGRRWEPVHARYLRTVVKACRAARRELLAEGTVGREFLVVAMDEARELVPRTLTPAQVRRHFPELDAKYRETARLAALPVGRRTRELIALVEAPPGSAAFGREQATALLRAVGADAVPQVVERLAHARVKWPWAKLLAELRVSTEAVTGTLARVAADRRADGADRAWAARALSRLGRTDLLLALADRLPEEVTAQGLAAPYTAFRDVGAHAPLDYRPLEQALDTRPGLHAAVLDAFRPGRSLCETGPAEADTALDGLNSRWPAVRCHALLILEGVRLSRARRERFTAGLTRLCREDPDATVREVAAGVARRTGR